MCGIAGTVDLRRGLDSAERLVAEMTEVQAHRGPDGAGLMVDSDAVLGHRRLAILDLTDAGRQPMASPDGSLWITYNGEVYNYLELADDLRARGHRFRSACDTEVLLHAYAEWGEASLERLNGMFAFAIWDRRRGRLFCARDRFGVKPLYYTVAEGRFRFASEIKALLLDPAVPRRPNEPRVLDFLVHGLADHSAETMFEGVQQLEPGHLLTVDTASGAVRTERWYEPLPAELGADPVAAVRERLLDSVALRLRSDVPVGTCLSGGLDSSCVVSITGLLRREAGVDVPDSFTARCLDPLLDESRYVEQVVAVSGARNHTVLPDDEDIVGSLDLMLWHMDEPFHGPTVYGHWKVMELARRTGVTVLLDGQGGDEVFGGYHYMYPSYFLSLLRGGDAGTALAELRTRARIHGVGPARSAADLLKLLLPAGMRGRGRPDWISKGVPVPAAPIAGRLLDAQQQYGLMVSPLPAYLHHEDRNSMSFSLEARVPFLDYRVVEAGLALGPAQLLHDGKTKWALRQAMRGLVPAEILDRPDKQGFSVDQASWVGGALGSAIVETLTGRAAASRPFFDGARLAEAAVRPAAGDAAALWRAFVVERWLRVFFDRDLEVPAAAHATESVAPRPVPLSPADVVRPHGDAAGVPA
jgi:asparagine synthase (glutamine-hydrolysing)